MYNNRCLYYFEHTVFIISVVFLDDVYTNIHQYRYEPVSPKKLFDVRAPATEIHLKNVWENQNDLGQNRFPNTYNISRRGQKPFPKSTC